MNFAELIAAAAGRTATSTTTDPFYASLGGRVNEALAEFDTAIATHWPWSIRPVTFTTVADEGDYSFADIQALVVDNVGVEIGHQFPLVRILEVDTVVASTGVRCALERVPGIDLAACRMPSAARPIVWNAEGNELQLGPVPNQAVTLELRVVIGERAMVTDNDVPLAPAWSHFAVVQLARAFVFEMRGDDDRATVARDVFDKQVRTRVMPRARQAGGPGRPSSEAR